MAVAVRGAETLFSQSLVGQNAIFSFEVYWQLLIYCNAGVNVSMDNILGEGVRASLPPLCLVNGDMGCSCGEKKEKLSLSRNLHILMHFCCSTNTYCTVILDHMVSVYG